ncbi:MAG: sodium:solute symporter [Pirellulaceae bacterium]|nr:sodium:solute symporter [Planctomycetales bacterium]
MNLAIHKVDIAIVLTYLMAIMAFGVWIGKNPRTTLDYFLGGRTLPWWALLLSIVATETSTVTFLSVPGKSFAPGGNLTFLQLAIGYIIGRTIVVWILLPAYFRSELFTSYELLQHRFGTTTRRLSSLLFLATRNAADAIRLYLTALVLKQAIGMDLIPCIVLLGIVTTIYTLAGGMKSVVWNDVIQFTVYMLGAMWALGVILRMVPGGWSTIVEFGRETDRWQLLTTAGGMNALNIWAGAIGGAFLTLATHGTDQLIVQRVLGAKSQRHASVALIGSGLVVFVQFALFLVIGVGLACYYQQSPPATAFTDNDEVFASFIVNHLGVGIVGITLAAVFSAAMSTLSSSLNSSASVFVNDFYVLLQPNSSEDQRVRISRISTLVFGILQVAIAIAVINIAANTAVVDRVLFIAGFASGPILGLFFLASLSKHCRESDALFGFVGGVLILCCVVFGPHLIATTGSSESISSEVEAGSTGVAVVTWIPQINGYWYSLIGSVATFLFAQIHHVVRRKTGSL